MSQIKSADITFDEFLDSIQKAHAGMDITVCWPAHPGQIEAAVSDLTAMRAFVKYKTNRTRFLNGMNSVPVDSIRSYLYQAGLIGLKVARLLPDLGHTDVSVTESIEFVLDLISNIKERVFSDPLCRDGRNIIYTPEQIESWLSRGTVSNLTGADKLEIAGLNITAESLSWALFYDMYRSGGFRMSGPYITPIGTVLVRENIDLAPPFWPFTYKYKYLREILVYEDDIEVENDFANHFIYRKPIINKLKAYRIEVDNQMCSAIDDIRHLTEYLDRLRKNHVEYIDSLNPQEIIKSGAQIVSYLYKGLWDYYKEDWHPSKEVEDRINRDGLKYWHKYYPYQSRKDESADYYRRLYDLRNDFLG
ncbi:hypothetical protein A2154_02810 [Candidatus Gottesmanbacteria bacterium RBG_16_43_7]|uniref:Uncharacterized protein n=1 Tax=Candidatus Gottesmanbacteria bacterium RBG_16_43_7 TaxID=1798373 RepID=A0A1F5Z9P4_9BACT|nr:MAG: hypothetical protein A2154_02810 [Candidatus Gottesmanbacteria bacterium RBG_16_43_7]